MYRLQFLVYVDVKLSTLSDLTRKIDLQIAHCFYRIFLVKWQLDDLRWHDNSKTPRIWGLNRLKNMISDINRYLHKALSPRNHFQIWSLFHRRGFTNFSCFDFEFKTERLAGRMCLCALIGCSTKHCFGLRFCKVSKCFLNVPKWNKSLKAKHPRMELALY